jgi:nitrogenase subunit NifH
MITRLALAALICGCTVAAQAETKAEQLAALSWGKALAADTPEVKRLQAALTRGMTVCDFESDSQLANVAWSATKTIREAGQYAEATEIVEGVNAALLGAKARQDCIKFIALYGANRVEGRTHSDAVVGARALYRVAGVVD